MLFKVSISTKVYITLILVLTLNFSFADNDDFPVTQQTLPESVNLTFSKPWQAPHYGNQNTIDGYSENVFAVPPSMKNQVQFWIDIYTKYSTIQGVLHDSEDINKIYEVVDFKDLNEDPHLTLREKEKLKVKRVKELKKQIAEREKIPKKEMDRIRFQLGLKDRMIEAIYFSGRYLQEMEKIFQDQGLPKELTRLPFVESSFNIMARSKVGASGIWQIMRYTAKPYKMINNAVDKRNHPIESTRVAAKILKFNYEMLQSWPLAITGYNHGPTGVKRMVEKYKTREISALVDLDARVRNFGFASRNFYATFLAALEVEKNATKYFPKVLWAQDLENKTIQLTRPIHFSELLLFFEGDRERAKIFNPHLSHAVLMNRVTIPAKSKVEVPKEKYEFAVNSLNKKGPSLASSRSRD